MHRLHHIDHAGQDHRFEQATLITNRRELEFSASGIMGAQYPPEYVKHHIDRLHRLTTASHELGRAASVNELMQHLFSPRAWGSMAESETYAHLEHLRLGGMAERKEEAGKLHYLVR